MNIKLVVDCQKALLNNCQNGSGKMLTRIHKKSIKKRNISMLSKNNVLIINCIYYCKVNINEKMIGRRDLYWKWKSN